MTSPARVITVTVGLSIFGAIVGAAAGVVSLLFAVLLSGHSLFDLPDVLQIPAVIGAFLGAILTPMAGWMLLRRVPLGRAFAGLAAGTIGGGIFGWFALKRWNSIEGAVVCAVIGFIAAAVAMRYSKSARVAAAD